MTEGNFAGATLLTDGDALSSSCGGSGAPEAVFGLDIFGGILELTVTVETSDPDHELAVYVLEATCDAATELGCGSSNPFAPGKRASFTVSGLTAGVYYVVVDGMAAGDAGDYRLSLSWE